jgi:general secretion pathway protein F
LVLFIGLGATARWALRRPLYRRRWHAFLLSLPWLGPLVRGVDTSRFASTLAILVAGGVPLLGALASAARAMGNVVMGEAVERAIERVREGVSLARALGEARAFPPLLVHLVASGELSGKLEQMLDRAARLETQALERRLATFLTLLEPVMILVMGAAVLLIVLAILLPIIEINQLVR